MSAFFKSNHAAAGLALLASVSVPAVAAGLAPAQAPKPGGAMRAGEASPRRRAGGAGAVQPGRPADPRRQLLRLPRAGQEQAEGQPAPRSPRGRDRARRGRAGEAGEERPRHADLRDRREASCRRSPRTSRLTPAQKATLKRWIAQGAQYEGHWSYIPPRRPPVPRIADARYPVRNAIDCFVRARLKAKGLLPSPEADRRTLIRRLYFDLLGLPPTPEEVAGVRRRQVAGRLRAAGRSRCWRTRTTASGWRMGWLDVVRFADTIGYHSDNAAQRLALPRLGHQELQRQQAVRPLHHRAARRRPAARRERRRRGSARPSTACCSRPRKAAPSRRSTRRAC